MALMRYLLSLGVNLLLAVAGGLLAKSGATALTNSIILYQSLDSAAGESGQTVRDVFGLTGQTSLSFSDIVVPLFFTVGLLIVGGALLVIGLRGLVRRVAAGLPAEDEGDPKTETGRMGQMVLYGLGTAFGLWGLTLGALDSLSYLVLSASGVHATAEIETIRTQNSTRDGNPPGVYFDYSFKAVSGEVVTGSQLVPSSEFSRANRDGGQIAVTYDFGHPESHEFPQLRDWSGIARFMAVRLLLAGFGIWGLRRVVRIGKIEDHGAHPSAA